MALYRAGWLLVLSWLILGVGLSCSDENASTESPFDVARSSIVHIETDTGNGSGVVFDLDGHVVTNYHVIGDAQFTGVVLPNGSSTVASVIGFDRAADVAVLRISSLEAGTTPIEFAKESEVRIGDPVHVVGFPFEGGEDSPIAQISSGVISARRPHVLGMLEFFQADASFNPGASGGAMVNDFGQLVGLPTRRLFTGDGGLAITVDDVIRIAKDLIESEEKVEAVGPSVGTSVSDNTTLQSAYYVRLADEDFFRASLSSNRGATASLFDRAGFEVAVSEEAEPETAASIFYVAERAGPFALVIHAPEVDPRFSISSTHLLRPYLDEEDGERLMVGDTFVGELQFVGDEDAFDLPLDTGDRVRVLLRSWDFDAHLRVTPPMGILESRELSDDDSGRGFQGGDALVTVRAVESGLQKITVSAQVGLFAGGSGFYSLEIREAE